MVKNRRKDGDHYWVQANVTPVLEGGRTVGYLSVRTRPGRAQVQAAEALYGRLREEAARTERRIGLGHGEPVRLDAMGRLGHWLRPGARARLVGVTLLLAWASAALGSALPGQPGAWPMSLAGAALLALAAASWLGRAAVAPLRGATAAANRMAAGELGGACAGHGRDEAGRLARGLGQLNVNLQAVIGDVRREVVGIHGTSDDISRGSEELFGRTEEQAGQLQQTAAALEQMTASIRQNADAAGSAAGLAQEAADVAQRGGSAASEAAARMEEIRHASARIAEIIAVIDGISFQTNIPALNAAVEAARAGESGRGFAVVAGEVRALAQRTSGAAREIKTLIEDASAKVEAGSRLVQDTGATVQQTVATVQRVSGLVAEISHASGEQAAGVTQLNAAMARLDSLTQQNASMVEPLADAAHRLQGQARWWRTRSISSATAPCSPPERAALRPKSASLLAGRGWPDW
ncbi:methyl-accepting chemotaxis protein [Eleftheria terrae]|uniref:methyl-accepting chemotaxis protein n=1 Tax=Eleftheria terrae TaxID=1597781 RepID=UPI00263B000D|nr:methyl-accepting chemotaxis protein [Eleftheria terrae]WKB55007.1 methyl-accepting chemotaxis protein [Eleftheria terrae]